MISNEIATYTVCMYVCIVIAQYVLCLLHQSGSINTLLPMAPGKLYRTPHPWFSDVHGIYTPLIISLKIQHPWF